MKTRLIVFILYLATSSCATLKYVEPDLPLPVRSRFSACRGGSGEARLNLTNKDYSLSAFLEWMSLGKVMDIRVSDDLGRTIIFLKGRSRHFIVKKDKTGLFSQVGFEDQFITYSGSYTGISYGELACFLEGKWPSYWLSHMVNFRNFGDGHRLTFKINDRLIDLNLSLDKECALLEWSEFLGLYSMGYEVCMARRQSKIRFKSGATFVEIRNYGT